MKLLSIYHLYSLLLTSFVDSGGHGHSMIWCLHIDDKREINIFICLARLDWVVAGSWSQQAGTETR